MTVAGEALLAIGLISAGLFVAGYVLQNMALQHHEVSQTLQSMRTYEAAPPEQRQRELSPPFHQRVLLPIVSRLASLGRRLLPGGSMDRLRRELVRAGRAGTDADRVMAYKIMAAVGLGIFLPVLASLTGTELLRSLTLVGVAGGVGYFAPSWMVRSRAKARQEAIRNALPDTLDLLAITVEAGLSFDQALSRITSRADGPLAEELQRLQQEIQLGKQRGDAWQDLADRTDVGELKSFVLAMVQADQFGVSIVRLLKVQSHEIRVKRRQRAEEMAQKIPVKIVFPLVFCILPSLFVVLLGPAAINVYRAFAN